MRGATALNGSCHHRSKIDTSWGILPSACDTLAEALLLAGLDHDCIAEGNGSRPCGLASTSELPVPKWLPLGHASPIRSFGAFPGCLTVECLVSVGMAPQMARDDRIGGGGWWVVRAAVCFWVISSDSHGWCVKANRRIRQAWKA
jgi:hypothetical protein